MFTNLGTCSGPARGAQLCFKLGVFPKVWLECSKISFRLAIMIVKHERIYTAESISNW